MNVTPIEILVTRACDPSLPEPNFALHLEVAEYITNKKANTCVKKPPSVHIISMLIAPTTALEKQR
jgi:hypothetical protein